MGMSRDRRAMPEPLLSIATAGVVARLATDRAAAGRIGDAVAQAFDPEQVAVAEYEEMNGCWSLAIHFRDPPNEAAVRALVALAAGTAAANALTFETLTA